MAKTNAQRQAEWRLRRKQELDSLRNGLAPGSSSIGQISAQEYEFLMLQLQRYRADNASAGVVPDRLDKIQSVMRMRAEIDKAKVIENTLNYKKSKPVTNLTRDLFDQ